MVVEDPASLGRVIAHWRKQVGWSQTVLARRVGATQAWVSGLEAGKPGAAVGQVLRVTRALGLRVEVSGAPPVVPSADGIDLDAYVNSARFRNVP